MMKELQKRSAVRLRILRFSPTFQATRTHRHGANRPTWSSASAQVYWFIVTCVELVGLKRRTFVFLVCGRALGVDAWVGAVGGLFHAFFPFQAFSTVQIGQIPSL